MKQCSCCEKIIYDIKFYKKEIYICKNCLESKRYGVGIIIEECVNDGYGYNGYEYNYEYKNI